MDRNPIQKFFHDQEVFITGATGLIGKSVVEKLLRSCPGIKKLYVLLREKRGKGAIERLEELKKNQIFDRIRNEGKGDFLNKLSIVSGNMGDIKCGLSENDISKLENVSIIFHIAATIRFDEPLKNAVLQNIRGTRELLLIAETLKKLKKFVHCSTAYTNPNLDIVEERLYHTRTDWKDCIKLAEKYDQSTLNILGAKFMGDFPNTYTFTKHVAEHCVNSFKDRLPIAIFRPAIVINAFAEPYPGWYNSFVGPVGIIATAGTGLVRVCDMNPNAKYDFVPLDITAILMIMISWKDSVLPPLQPNEDIHIYHYSLHSYQAESTDMITRKILYYFTEKYSFENSYWFPRVTYIQNKFYFMLNVYIFHLLPGIFLDLLIKLKGHKPFVIKIHRQVLATLAVIRFFTQKTFNFENKRMSDLLKESRNFSDEFKYDHALKINSDEKLEAAVIGVRKYLLKNSDESIPSSIRKVQMLKWLDRITYWCFYYWVATKSFNFMSNYIQSKIF